MPKVIAAVSPPLSIKVTYAAFRDVVNKTAQSILVSSIRKHREWFEENVVEMKVPIFF